MNKTHVPAHMARWLRFLFEHGVLPVPGIARGTGAHGGQFLRCLTRAIESGSEECLRGPMDGLLASAGVRLADIDVAVLVPKKGQRPRLGQMLTQMQLSDRLARLEAFQAAHGHALAVWPIGEDRLLSAFILYGLRHPGVLAGEPRLTERFPGLWALSAQRRRLPVFAAACRRFRDCTDRHGRMTESAGLTPSLVVAASRLRVAARAGKLPEAMVAALRWAGFSFGPYQPRATDNGEATWRKNARRILATAETQGHFRFPAKSSDKTWCSAQRIRFRAGGMPAWQERLLRQAGFPFDVSKQCPFGPDWFRERMARLKEEMALPNRSPSSLKFLRYMRELDRRGKLCPERRAALVALGADFTGQRRRPAGEALLSLWRSFGHRSFLKNDTALVVLNDLRRRSGPGGVRARAALVAAGFPKALLTAGVTPTLWLHIEALLEAGRARGFDFAVSDPHHWTLLRLRKRHARGALSRTHLAQLRQGGFPMGMLRG